MLLSLMAATDNDGVMMIMMMGDDIEPKNARLYAFRAYVNRASYARIVALTQEGKDGDR